MLGTRASGPHGEYRDWNQLSLLSLLPSKDGLGPIRNILSQNADRSGRSGAVPSIYMMGSIR